MRQKAARAIAQWSGWTVQVPASVPSRCVIIGAPHTSATDLWLTLLFMEVSGIRFQWVAKDSMFRWPLGRLWRSLGGVPVNRRERSNFVEGVVNIFREKADFRFALLPEGTRQKSSSWKTGFYFIAVGANVPIVFGFLDYSRKVVGLGPTLVPTGDIEADFNVIRAFYTEIKGKYPDQQGEVRIRTTSD